jgi:hypothetical protein
MNHLVATKELTDRASEAWRDKHVARRLWCEGDEVEPVVQDVLDRRVLVAAEVARSCAHPEFMAMEGVWKTTRKLTTHNAFFVTPDQRDAKLTQTFNLFQRRPKVIAAHVTKLQ